MSGNRRVLTAEQLAAINAPIETAISLPAESYLSREFFDAERERIFNRHWVCVLFDFDVAEPGQALPFELCGMPLLAVRDQQGKLRVFHNVIPYDGCLAIIEPARGLGEITTPYHGWVSGLDGAQRLQRPFVDFHAHARMYEVSAVHDAVTPPPDTVDQVYQTQLFRRSSGNHAAQKNEEGSAAKEQPHDSTTEQCLRPATIATRVRTCA